MDFETIKKEFIKELEKELIKKKASYKKASNFKDIADNLENASGVGKQMLDILNNVLNKNKVDFSKEEHLKFEEYIEPTFKEYLLKLLNGII